MYTNILNSAAPLPLALEKANRMEHKSLNLSLHCVFVGPSPDLIGCLRWYSVHSISKRRLPGTGTTVGVWETGKWHSFDNRLGKKQTKCTAWFPDLLRLQILIPCSTPKWRGKALEIASLGMMSEGNTLCIDHLSAPSKTDTATQSTYEGTSLLHKQQTWKFKSLNCLHVTHFVTTLCRCKMHSSQKILNSSTNFWNCVKWLCFLSQKTMLLLILILINTKMHHADMLE